MPRSKERKSPQKRAHPSIGTSQLNTCLSLLTSLSDKNNEIMYSQVILLKSNVDIQIETVEKIKIKGGSSIV